MEIKKALDETFQDIVRFIGAILFYVAVPLRAPRNWPALAKAQRTPAKSESFIETRLYFLLALTLLIYVLNQWFGDFISGWDMTGVHIRGAVTEEDKRTSKVAQQLVQGVITDPVVIGSLVGAVVGTALLQAWINLGASDSIESLHDGLVIVSLGTLVIYATAVIWIVLSVGINLTVGVDGAAAIAAAILDLAGYDSLKRRALNAIYLTPLFYAIVAVMALALSYLLFTLLLWLPWSVYNFGAASDKAPALRHARRTTRATFIIVLLGSGVGVAMPRLLHERDIGLGPLDFVFESGAARNLAVNDIRAIEEITSRCHVVAIVQNESGKPLLLRRQQEMHVVLTVSTQEAMTNAPRSLYWRMATRVMDIGDDQKNEIRLSPKESVLIKSEGLKYGDSQVSLSPYTSRPMKDLEKDRADIVATIWLNAAGTSIVGKVQYQRADNYWSCMPGIFRLPLDLPKSSSNRPPAS